MQKLKIELAKNRVNVVKDGESGVIRWFKHDGSPASARAAYERAVCFLQGADLGMEEAVVWIYDLANHLHVARFAPERPYTYSEAKLAKMLADL